ncbi:unnamed protein product [Pleuronectes platessa]|uniref:Uncharacterized protein n=1 Tax=Pleuronectes platessa TaxID=8262 RepID=A0A9N7TSL0_PLEPL|nr:unnamed protein product [Pleuronectes platessa]
MDGRMDGEGWTDSTRSTVNAPTTSTCATKERANALVTHTLATLSAQIQQLRGSATAEHSQPQCLSTGRGRGGGELRDAAGLTLSSPVLPPLIYEKTLSSPAKFAKSNFQLIRRSQQQAHRAYREEQTGEEEGERGREREREGEKEGGREGPRWLFVFFFFLSFLLVFTGFLLLSSQLFITAWSG